MSLHFISFLFFLACESEEDYLNIVEWEQSSEKEEEVLDEDIGYQFELMDLLNPSYSQIWNGLVPLEDGFAFTTMYDKQLNLRQYSVDFHEEMHPIQVTFVEDIFDDDYICDHAITGNDESLYIAVSTFSAQTLSIIKTSHRGIRVEPPVNTD